MSASAHQLIDEDGHLCNGDSNQKKNNNNNKRNN